MDFLTFMGRNARWLAGGFLLCFFSSFGQTFYISLSNGDIRREFDLSNGDFGLLYMAATLASAATLPALGWTLDRFKAWQVAVVTVLNGTEWVNIPWDEFLVIFGGLTGLYTGGRTYIKGVAAKAIVQAAVDGK